jgi:hypothetical protein
MNAIDYWYKKYMALKETERIPKPELTWKDIKTIVQILEESDWYDFEINCKLWSQEFYEEVLTRFKQYKEEQQ